jgi:uncharacterized spore protein YtfJ
MDIDALLQGNRDAVTVRRIYGDPVEQDGVIVVPAAVIIGGAGGGGDTEGNGGSGFGLIGRPSGAWVIKDGDVSWRPAIDLTRLAAIGAMTLLAVVRMLRR